MEKCLHLIVIFIAVVFIANVSGQKDKVSPKLDFDESEEKDNRSSSTTPNQQGSTGTGKNTSPKIHGVRVSVDTGDTKKSSKESKESVEITENRNKKRVGIHTDITFEITGAGVEVSNQSVTGQGHDKEENDASVPVYKGRGSTTNRPRKPYDPKTHHWNPNHSAERRQGGGHHHYPHNVPVYPGTNDEERSYYEPYRPNAVTGFKSYETYTGGPRWKPCYCMSSAGDSRRRRDDPGVRATSSVIQIVDSKLDGPFSSRKKR